MASNYDISIIRPEVRSYQVRLRYKDIEPIRLKQIRKALMTFHNLEKMAVNIYRFQISSRNSDELNTELIKAMLNEMTHVQDFQVKLFEYGISPSVFATGYSLLGAVFGFLSHLFGEASIKKMGVWVESKAVSHYGELLESIEWDEDTRKIIEKDFADENGHINRWKS